MSAVFRLVCAIAVSILFPLTSVAATYYISPNGSNSSGDGTSSKPWASLSKACSAVRNPGDIIKVTAGNYTDNSNCDLAIGVSIEGAGKAVTTITTAAKGYYILAFSALFVDGNNTISGITFRGGTSITARKGDGCIRFQRRHNSVVHDCNIEYFESPAAGDGNAVEFLGDVNWDGENTVPPAQWMEGCKLYNSRITACHRDFLYRAAVTALGLSGLEIHDTIFDETGTGGFCLKGSPGWLKGAKIYRNTFTVDPSNVPRTEKLSIELWNICQDTEIYGNTFNNGYLSFVSGQKLQGTNSFTFHDNIVNNGIKSEFSVSDHRAYRNVFHGYGHDDNDMGSGISFWPSHASATHDLSNIEWSYNEFIGMFGIAILIMDKPDDPVGPMYLKLDGLEISNNVFDGLTDYGAYSAAIAITPFVSATTLSGIRIDNNIFTGLTTAVKATDFIELVHGEIRNNAFFQVQTPWSPSLIPNIAIGWNLFDMDPKFRDAVHHDYNLLPDSPCIDAGKDMGHDYYPKYGLGYDIGAHEYLPSGPSVHIGVFRDGAWYLDSNGSGGWDSGADVTATFGISDDLPVAGQWTGSGGTRIGVFRSGAWYLDLNGNGAWDDGIDAAYSFGISSDIPVTGKWAGGTATKIGVFRNGAWHLDMNGNGAWDEGDVTYTFGIPGDIPVTGDWDGSGTTKIGVVRGNSWFLDMNGNGAWDEGIDAVYSFGIPGDKPVTGDWNGSGTTKIGVVRGGSDWFLDVNGNGAWDEGVDRTIYGFGIPGDVPVTGTW